MAKIYFGGTILTMEDTEPQAVLVKDGRIAVVGTLADCQRAAPEAELVDLNGGCLMPGFIDSHSHMVMAGQMAQCADLSGCQSFGEIVEVLKAYIAQHRITPDGCVMGFGYDHNFLAEQRHPGKAVLDAVSREIPIMVMHVSAHMGCVNSAALNLAGIDETTPDPAGGVIGRCPGSREPDGYLEEGATMLVSRVLGSRMNQDPLALFADMQRDYLKNGVTTVQDGATTAAEWAVLQAASKQGLLKVDVVAYPLMPKGGVELVHKYGDDYKEYKNRLKIGGYKLVLDGSPQGKSAWLTEPYEGEDDYRGYPWLSDRELQDYVNLAVAEHRQLLTHCNGDAAADQLLRAYEKADRGEDLRPVMIHCQTVRKDQLAKMAELGMMASIFADHVWYWGDIHLKNLGQARGSRISPVKSALEAGVKVTLHQDTPVVKPRMLASVWAAVNRISRSGKRIGPEERVSVMDALRAVTVNAAYAYFEEDSKGSIAPGKRADLVILDRDPRTAPDLREITVLQTIKDGQTVYQKG